MDEFVQKYNKIVYGGEGTELPDEVKERVKDRGEKDNKPLPSQFSNSTNSNDEQAASTSGGSSQPPKQGASSSVTTGPAGASYRDTLGGLAHMDYATFLRVDAWVNNPSNRLMEQKPFHPKE